MTETPANTPKPIGNTSSFFPGGSRVVGAPAFSAVGVEPGDEPGERDEGDDEDGSDVTVGGSSLSGCGVAVGSGTEETPMTTAGTPGDGTTLPVPELLGGDDTELLASGRGTVVSVTEIAGSGTDTELAGGKPVTAGLDRTVLEERPELGGTSVGVGESVSLVLVKVGDDVEVEGGNSVDTVELDAGGGRALEVSLPLSGVSTHFFTSLTTSTPSTTAGVRVIVHVWMNVPTPVVIFSVTVTVAGSVN